MNRDLLLAGALLHDLGKMPELDGCGSYDYSDAGRFCGHVVLTDRMVLAAIARRSYFPERLQLLLTHLLLSHHGQLEWGAPVVPKTAEALALHYADNLDARVQMFEDYRESAESGPGPWSPYHRSLGRHLYLGQSEKSEEPSPETSSAQCELGYGGSVNEEDT
jgi:3'-5' exoribonuclease